jgi:hypothetical protein
MPPVRAGVAFVCAYAGLALLAALLARSSAARPVLLQALAGPAVVGGLGGLCGAAAYRSGGAVAGFVALVRAVPIPGRARRWLSPAAAALGAYLAAAALVLAVALVAAAGGVASLHRALVPGVLGGAVLTVAQLAVLPNVAVWVAAVLAGPGFAIGSGTSVTLAASTLGPLPAVPLFAALPAPGPLPGVALALLACPLLAGTIAGALVLRHGSSGLRARLLDSGGSGFLAGVAFMLLAWVSGGSVGPGRLAETGPRPLLAGSMLAAEVAVGAAVTVLVQDRGLRVLAAVRGRRRP